MSAGTVGVMLFRKWRKSGVLDVAQAQGTAAGRGVGSVMGVKGESTQGNRGPISCERAKV